MAYKYIDRAYLTTEYSLQWADDTTTLSDVNLNGKITRASREINLISKGQIERDIADGKLDLNVSPATPTTDAIKYATALLTEALLLNDGNFNQAGYSQSSGGESYSGSDDGKNWAIALERAGAMLADVGYAGTFSIGSVGISRTETLDIDEYPGSSRCLTRDQLFDQMVNGIKLVNGTVAFTDPAVPSQGITITPNGGDAISAVYALRNLSNTQHPTTEAGKAIVPKADGNGIEYKSIAASVDLTPYAKTADLAPYAKTTDLAPYAKTTALSEYAHTTLDNASFTPANAGKLVAVGAAGKGIQYVDASSTGGNADLTNYYTKTEINASQKAQDDAIALQNDPNAKWITTEWVQNAETTGNGATVTYKSSALSTATTNINGDTCKSAIGFFQTIKKTKFRSGIGTIYIVSAGANIGKVARIGEILTMGPGNGFLNQSNDTAPNAGAAGVYLMRRPFIHIPTAAEFYSDIADRPQLESEAVFNQAENDARYVLKTDAVDAGADKDLANLSAVGSPKVLTTAYSTDKNTIFKYLINKTTESAESAYITGAKNSSVIGLFLGGAGYISGLTSIDNISDATDPNQDGWVLPQSDIKRLFVAKDQLAADNGKVLAIDGAKVAPIDLSLRLLASISNLETKYLVVGTGTYLGEYLFRQENFQYRLRPRNNASQSDETDYTHNINETPQIDYLSNGAFLTEQDAVATAAMVKTSKHLANKAYVDAQFNTEITLTAADGTTKTFSAKLKP